MSSRYKLAVAKTGGADCYSPAWDTTQYQHEEPYKQVVDMVRIVTQKRESLAEVNEVEYSLVFITLIRWFGISLAMLVVSVVGMILAFQYAMQTALFVFSITATLSVLGISSTLWHGRELGEVWE